MKIKDINDTISVIKKSSTYLTNEKKLHDINAKLSSSNIWNDNNRVALQLSQELSNLKSKLMNMSEIEKILYDTEELYKLAIDEEDKACINECEYILNDLGDRIYDYRINNLMNGEYDDCNAYMQILAGVGGTESSDWVTMLYNMYKKWAINLKMKVKIIDEQKDPDYQDGYRNITFKIEGKYAYGWTKIDAGTHRLVRISPFDPQHKRHTSFAQVLVYPDIQIMNNNEINNCDLRIDTFRSSGAGGQSVNKTDSAIRITHIPTGIVVSCQNERSQHQNKSVALSILRSKLLQLDKENKKKQISESTLGKGQAVWGNQIRSIVLQPYKVVKDNRTEFETSNVDEYLNGGNVLNEAMLLALENDFIQ